jgi:hypothetical protein
VAAASWWPVSVANERMRETGNRSAQVIAKDASWNILASQAKEAIQN